MGWRVVKPEIIIIITIIIIININSADPDQTPHCAASDLGLHCLIRPWAALFDQTWLLKYLRQITEQLIIHHDRLKFHLGLMDFRVDVKENKQNTDGRRTNKGGSILFATHPAILTSTGIKMYVFKLRSCTNVVQKVSSLTHLWCISAYHLNINVFH